MDESFFDSFYESIEEEVDFCERIASRRYQQGLFSKCDIVYFNEDKTANYCQGTSDKILQNIDILTYDSVIFSQSLSLPKFSDLLYTEKKFTGALGVIWYQKGADFYSVFNKSTFLDVNNSYYCFKAEDLVSLFIQKRAIDLVKDKGSKNAEWIYQILLNKSEISTNLNRYNYTPKSYLNESQVHAISNALTAVIQPNSFYLIEGPPGTGKTTIIAEIINELTNKKKRILVTSHTNIAINNAMEKLIEMNPSIKSTCLRIAHPGKISKDLHDILPVSKVRDPDHIIGNQNIEELISKHNVIGATISKVANMTYFGLLNLIEPFFDVVIIDESSMVTIPSSLSAILHGKSFILFGDIHQLPPIIHSKRDSIANISFLEFLLKKFPYNSSLLNTQYRCNEAIIEFSNSSIYGNKLISSDIVKDNKIETINVFSDNTLNKIFDPHNVVVWIKHFNKAKWIRRESSGTYSAVNEFEAAVTVKLLKILDEIGFNKKRIAILSFYRMQADLIRKTLTNYTKPDSELPKLIDLETELSTITDSSTIDSYQGREKEIILINLVQDHRHESLDDYRRLNVALTRAKTKLIILGHHNLGCIMDKSWNHVANPYNLFYYVKKLENKPIRENRGIVITDFSENKLVDELKTVHALVNELGTIQRTEEKNLYSNEDRYILRFLRKKRRIREILN